MLQLKPPLQFEQTATSSLASVRLASALSLAALASIIAERTPAQASDLGAPLLLAFGPRPLIFSSLPSAHSAVLVFLLFFKTEISLRYPTIFFFTINVHTTHLPSFLLPSFPSFPFSFSFSSSLSTSKPQLRTMPLLVGPYAFKDQGEKRRALKPRGRGRGWVLLRPMCVLALATMGIKE